jgi:hypothetical protein
VPYESCLREQCIRERGPGVAWDSVFAEWLQADVVGSGVEVGVDELGDLLGAALRDERVDQPV